jgi:hypothetical protein
VDQIATMQFVDFGDGTPTRALICTQPNQWNYPAKDRSGRLEPIEEPHLGKWLAKLTGKSARKPTSTAFPEKANQTEAAEGETSTWLTISIMQKPSAKAG